MALTMLFLVIAFVLFLLLDWIRDNANPGQSLRKLQHDNATLMAQLDRSAAQAKQLRREIKRLQNRA